jgi:hypothetical protein
MDSNDSEEKDGKNELNPRKALNIDLLLMTHHHGEHSKYPHEIWESFRNKFYSLLELQDDNTNNLGLIFNLAEYDADEIAEIIGLLSSLYQSVGGDALEIKTMGVYELTSKNILELVSH